MLKINLMLKLVFLGLLVKFGNVSCASFDHESKSDDGREVAIRGGGAGAGDALAIWSDSLSDPRVSMGQFFAALSTEVGGGDARPSFENSAKLIRIINGLVGHTVRRLNAINDPSNLESLLLVARLVSVWFCDGLSTSCTWLSVVEAEDGSRLSKPEALSHLMGEGGVVTRALDSIDSRRVLVDSRRGTNIFRLSEMFGAAAANFDATLLGEREFRRGRRLLSQSRAFAGGTGEISMLDVLDGALIRAATVQQSAGGDIARRVERLEDSRGNDAQRIAKLEGQMDVMLRYIDGLLRRPVTSIVNVAVYSWSWVPGHKGIQRIGSHLWQWVPCHERITGVVTGIPLLGGALSSVQK